jgi:hypothetical protein
VADTFPAALTVSGWSCTASGGSSCTATGSGTARTGTVTLLSGGSATYTATATLSPTATGSLANTATVTAPAGVTDPNLANNAATDTDTIALAPTRPALNQLDNFNRGDANTLNNGANWSQAVLLGSSAIRVNGSQAFCSNVGGLLAPCVLGGAAYWNAPTTGFGARQVAAFTFAAAPVNGSALTLKATGGGAAAPASFIKVSYGGGTVTVTTTTNGGLSTTSTASLTNANSAFASGDTLTAFVDAAGVVSVWKNTAFVGSVSLPNVAAWTSGTGRIGMQLPNGARVDNFSGGSVP